MKIALLHTGDEIIQGDTLNTNGHEIAHALHSEGLEMGRHMSCSDLETDIFQCIEFLSASHEILLITGGLGPTSDDRTRLALARFLNAPLIEFAEAVAHIQNRLSRKTPVLCSRNLQQAMFPATAKLLDNPNGTAMGCHFSNGTKHYFLLPGPPRECLPMFQDAVLPVLSRMQHQTLKTLKWRVFGQSESVIAQKLDDALQDLDCETGYRWEMPYVECKVRCHPDIIPTVKSRVEPLVSPHIISPVEKKASRQLWEALQIWQTPVQIIDEATGGHLQTLLQTPETWPWLNFMENKDTEMSFHIRGLESYWSNTVDENPLSISLHSRFSGGITEEAHEIVFRKGPIVTAYASEWLSFRLFHLINEQHQSVA